jgi:hypothetical protein
MTDWEPALNAALRARSSAPSRARRKPLRRR